MRKMASENKSRKQKHNRKSDSDEDVEKNVECDSRRGITGAPVPVDKNVGKNVVPKNEATDSYLPQKINIIMFSRLN